MRYFIRDVFAIALGVMLAQFCIIMIGYVLAYSAMWLLTR